MGQAMGVTMMLETWWETEGDVPVALSEESNLEPLA
eukprot:CAMPEP_0173451650 /NCGR_PEP_ID=MMETSP1357-20121228/47176_1 /TAXON_ID=77926 /ORGANISM="Hemiselmis rufescens, Strain PCC563" /LENGTH=35 /DNA_ID= /DNA_START= /DNA_END= /DNA_ORIENTATION=